MSLTERVDAALEALYEQVPDVDCKGLCWEACGPIDAHPRERRRMADAGVKLPAGDFRQRFFEVVHGDGDGRCPALDDDHRCRVYDVRPMICRVWGASEAMRCPHGCMPVDGRPLLTEAETAELVRRSMAPLQ